MLSIDWEMTESGNVSLTVCPLPSASANIPSLGMTAMTSVPVASANLLTVSSSPSTPREFRMIPIRRGEPVSKLPNPFMMLFAAYIAMNSPDVTRIIPSAYSPLKGTANPPHTTSPRTS